MTETDNEASRRPEKADFPTFLHSLHLDNNHNIK